MNNIDKLKLVSALILCVALIGCGHTMPIKPKFPEPPQELMKTPG